MKSVGILIVVAAVAAPTGFAKPPSPVKAYLVNVTPQIGVYHSIGARLDKILSELPMTNVDPKVEKLNKVCDSFEALALGWNKIEAPKGLKARHRGMGRVFEIQAQGWRIYAAALFTRHTDEIQAALSHLREMLRSAAYLQHRWSAALQGALIRAGIRVPGWLHSMATSP